MATVRTPNPTFTGVRHGVRFTGGVGVTDDPSAIARFQARGWTVEFDSAAPKQNDRKAAWVDYAVARGFDRGDADAMTKADLVEVLGAAR